MFPKVVQVVPMKDYTVYVYFEDGKIVCYDMKKMFSRKSWNYFISIQKGSTKDTYFCEN